MINGVTIFGKDISWYSILAFAGLVVAVLFCYRRKNKYNLPGDDVINLGAYAIIGAVIGGKLLALICTIPMFVKYWDKIRWNMEFLQALVQGGFVFYGGLIGVIVMFYIYSRQFSMNFANIMELAAPGVPLFHVFGRIGCYVTGCCGGINGFPLQLVESFMNFCIFVIIVIVQNKDLMKGKTFPLYIILYGTGRFILEFFRGDPERGFVGPLSVSQWISVFLIIVAVVICRKMEKDKKEA